MQHSAAHKVVIDRLRSALYDIEQRELRATLQSVFSSNAEIHLAHPIGDLVGPDALFENVVADLLQSIPDLERRDYIRIAGVTDQGAHWVGCAGYYTGVFVKPWLDIPPTGHQISMRFHEFFRLEDDIVVEMQALWDIPDVMRQAGAWPLAPSLGKEWHVPGPATNDGVIVGDPGTEQGAASCKHVIDMLMAMVRHPNEGGPELMELEKFWHPKMNWYGPSGIGTNRGIAGFRHWHQIPFLRAMPDRGQNQQGTNHHFFGEGEYVGVTGWPNMKQTLTHDGWLGLVPAGKTVTMRSLDFWRLEKGLIRENWVLVDLLDVYHQLGIDVFARVREFNKARNPSTISWPPLE